MLGITFALLLVQQAPSVDAYCFLGTGSRVCFGSSALLCVLDIPGEWKESTRPSATDPSGRAVRVSEVTASISASTDQIGSSRVVVALNGNLGSQAIELRGRYLAFVSIPDRQGHLYGNLLAKPEDLFIETAIRLPAGEFRFNDLETPTVAFYRAFSLRWAKMSVPQLRETLNVMPSLDPGDGKHERPTFTADAKAVFELASHLEPVRRILLLGDLKQNRFRPAERAFEEAVWAARNDSKLDETDADYSLFDGGMRGPGDLRFKSDELIAKAEQCSSDTAIGIYVRSLPSMAFDTRRLACLLAKSGPKSSYEIVRNLGIQSRDPSLYIHRVTQEMRDAELKRLVAYWKAKFNVGS